MRWSGFMLTGVCGLAMTMPALAQSSAQPRPFTFHWGVTTWIDQIDIGNDWQRQVDFRGAPIQRDFVIIYQHFLGETPWGGPHVTSQPGYWTRHFAEIRRWLDFWCPDPNFSGLLSLEHEWVPFTWQGRSSNPQVNDPLAQDRDFGDDWYEHMLANRPDEIAGLSGVELELRLRDTYEAAMREWFERTHDEVRRLRPNAKIGWYGFPNFRNFDYHWPNNPASAENDRLAYIFERQDVAMPVVYLNRAVVSGRAPHPDTEIAAEDNDLLIASNIREARRLSPTKPLIVFTTPIYMETNPAFGGQWMSELAIRQTYEIPRREGADGAIIWWAIRDRRGFEDFDRFFAETLVDPISDSFVAPPEPQLPPSAPQNQAQAPAGGESSEPSGGGSSSGEGGSGGGGSSGGAAPSAGGSSGGGSSGGSSSSSGSGSSGSSGGTGVNTFLPPPPPPQPQPSSPYQRAVAHLQNQQSSSGSTGGGSGSGGTSSGSSGTGSTGTGSTGSSGSGPEAGGSSGSSSSSAAARSAATRRNAATVRPSGAGVSRWMAPGSQRTAPAAGGRSGSSTGGSQATTPPRGNRVNVSAQDALRRMRQPVAPARPPSNRMSAMTTPANPRPQQRP